MTLRTITLKTHHESLHSCDKSDHRCHLKKCCATFSLFDTKYERHTTNHQHSHKCTIFCVSFILYRASVLYTNPKKYTRVKRTRTIRLSAPTKLQRSYSRSINALYLRITIHFYSSYYDYSILYFKIQSILYCDFTITQKKTK